MNLFAVFVLSTTKYNNENKYSAARDSMLCFLHNYLPENFLYICH
jgi:hypothetical protein